MGFTRLTRPLGQCLPCLFDVIGSSLNNVPPVPWVFEVGLPANAPTGGLTFCVLGLEKVSLGRTLQRRAPVTGFTEQLLFLVVLCLVVLCLLVVGKVVGSGGTHVSRFPWFRAGTGDDSNVALMSTTHSTSNKVAKVAFPNFMAVFKNGCAAMVTPVEMYFNIHLYTSILVMVGCW